VFLNLLTGIISESGKNKGSVKI